jgi:hypothetical protein
MEHCSAAFSRKQFDRRTILIQEVEHGPFDGFQVRGGIARSIFVGLFSKNRVQLPVTVILALPVGPDELS